MLREEEVVIPLNIFVNETIVFIEKLFSGKTIEGYIVSVKESTEGLYYIYNTVMEKYPSNEPEIYQFESWS